MGCVRETRKNLVGFFLRRRLRWAVKGKRREISPEFFQDYGNFDAVGGLGGVEVYFRGSARGGHGDDLVGQLVGTTEHIYVMSRCKGENGREIGAIAKWNANK